MGRPTTEPVRYQDDDGRQWTKRKVQRVCNGCGRSLGDATEAEIEGAIYGDLPDVTDECGCG